MNPVIFCSFQPCARKAEGDLIIEVDMKETRFPVCARHYEYIYNNSMVSPGVSSKEIVFSDEVPNQLIIPSENTIIV